MKPQTCEMGPRYAWCLLQSGDASAKARMRAMSASHSILDVAMLTEEAIYPCGTPVFQGIIFRSASDSMYAVID